MIGLYDYIWGMTKKRGMVNKKKKKIKTTAELTKGFEEFIKGKELNDNGEETFEHVIKNAKRKS